MKFLNKVWFFSLIFLWVIFWNIWFTANWNLPWVKIISRAEWWADESIRFRSTPRPTNNSTKWEKTAEQIKAENISKIRNAWMTKNFPLERKYEWSNAMFWSHYLIYPDYFNYHKNKIIIHHTAVDYGANRTINDVKKEIQHIYKYHTINRDFGDIGYNFLIDQMGNIYEWRAGGQWAVWMHASNNNVSSIWIALMWNFQNDTPTIEQMESLVNLTTAVSKYYHIDPLGYTYTFSTNTEKEPYVVATKNPNIMWHKNVKNTACPGVNLYNLLPKIRNEVLRRMKKWIVGNANLPADFLSSLKSSSKLSQSNNSQWTKEESNSKNWVNSNIANVSKISDFPKRLEQLQVKNPKIFQNAAQAARNNYKWNINKASQNMSKISKKYTINDIKNLVNQDISVLLYELTTKYDSFEIVVQADYYRIKAIA